MNRSLSPEYAARLNAAIAAAQGRDPRYQWFQSPDQWRFHWTTERMGDGKFASAVYVPHGPGSQSGKATEWRLTREVHHATRKAAKARALRLYRQHLAERKARPTRVTAAAEVKRLARQARIEERLRRLRQEYFDRTGRWLDHWGPKP